jgi:hypothetical protein
VNVKNLCPGYEQRARSANEARNLEVQSVADTSTANSANTLISVPSRISSPQRLRCELKRLNSSADTMDVYTVLCAKYKHETVTCGKLATITMESRRLFEAIFFVVGEMNDVFKMLIVATELQAWKPML